VVAQGADVHLEQMSDRLWWLCITKDGHEVRVFLVSDERISANME
jgi:hypothetical protein